MGRLSMNFAIFRQKFDEILPEFHRNGQEMTHTLSRFCEKVPEKFGKCYKFPEIVIFFIFHFIFSFVSLPSSKPPMTPTSGGLFSSRPAPMSAIAYHPLESARRAPL